MKKRNQLPVVWVTGASKGIGRAIAVAFARIGARVILSGRNRALLHASTKEINNAGGTASMLVVDTTNEKSVVAAYKKIQKQFDAVNVLVNNAGITSFSKFEKTSIKEFDAIINTNLRGYFLCTQAVLPAMLKKSSGYIFNIQSVAATTTFTNSSVYSASKAGALAMSRGLRAEVRKHGIRVIDVLPGAVETGMWSEKNRERFHEKMMQPEDVADVIVSLFCQPERVTTDEIVLRPVEGDL